MDDVRFPFRVWDTYVLRVLRVLRVHTVPPLSAGHRLLPDFGQIIGNNVHLFLDNLEYTITTFFRNVFVLIFSKASEDSCGMGGKNPHG